MNAAKNMLCKEIKKQKDAREKTQNTKKKKKELAGTWWIVVFLFFSSEFPMWIGVVHNKNKNLTHQQLGTISSN